MPAGLAPHIAHALLLAAGMAWKVGWSLVLGFLLSAFIQVFVSKKRMSDLLGGEGAGRIALASGFGAASSSCSYASAAIMRTLMAKGAGFIPSLAFLFASTNLVIELGVVLYLLMGWQFMAAEWLGGVVLIVIMSLLVRLTYPKRLVKQAREHAERASSGHDHGAMEAQGNFLARFFKRETYAAVASSFIMDWKMLWKDIAGGFLIAGFLAEFVPAHLWADLFASGAHPAMRLVANAALAPLIAVVTFVCSIGNVPMAAVLWAGGASFGGVIAFIYADLIVLPLLDAYRRYLGLKMAAYIAAIFYATMVLSAIIMDLIFSALGWVPEKARDIAAEVTHFAIDYTFWLNILFGAAALALIFLTRRARHEMAHAHHHHHHG
ncbi:MAG: permease [Parvularculaceae bacterium]